MLLSVKSLRWGWLVAGMAATFGVGAQTSQQQQVPDAPRPQLLPQLNTITPVAPAVAAPAVTLPAAPTPTPAVVDNAGAQAPGSSLPGSASPSSASPSVDGPVAGATGDADKDVPEIPSAGQGVEPFRIRRRVNFVEVPFTVKDTKGQLVPGLTWRDVRVYENGVREPMRVFTTDPFPLSVALVIDQSVTYDTMAKINESLAALQGAFTPYDKVAVFTYNNGVRAQDGGQFNAAQSARLGALLVRSKAKGREPNMDMGGPTSQTTVINNRQVDPNTTAVRGQQGITLNAPKEYHTLNDAILAAAQATATAERGRRRIVFVISDGKEYGSKATEKEVIRYLQTNRVAVYATLVGDSGVPGMGFLDRIHLPLTMRDDVLPRYAAATGGQVDPEFRQGGIEKSFARITEEVRTQYTVGYYSNEPVLDGKFRKLEVRVMRPSLTVIAKDGYYPSAQDSVPPPVTPTAVP